LWALLGFDSAKCDDDNASKRLKMEQSSAASALVWNGEELIFRCLEGLT
jgi:hypothetical protein